MRLPVTVPSIMSTKDCFPAGDISIQVLLCSYILHGSKAFKDRCVSCRNKKEVQDKYCYRQAEMGVGDVSHLLNSLTHILPQCQSCFILDTMMIACMYYSNCALALLACIP